MVRYNSPSEILEQENCNLNERIKQLALCLDLQAKEINTLKLDLDRYTVFIGDNLQHIKSAQDFLLAAINEVKVLRDLYSDQEKK